MKVINLALISVSLLLSISCGKSKTKNERTPTDTSTQNPPITEESDQVTIDTGVYKASSINIDGSYLGIQDQQLFNFNADLSPIGAVSFNMVNESGDSKKETPRKRPQKVVDLDEDYMILARTYTYCYPEDGCDPMLELNDETYIINKRTGDLWLLPNNYYPVPGSIKFRSNGVSKKVFMKVSGGEAGDNNSNGYDVELDSSFRTDYKTVILSIDLSNPAKPEARKQSPSHLDVVNYVVDSQGNLIFSAIDSRIDDFNEYYHALVPNGATPRFEPITEKILANLGVSDDWDLFSKTDENLLESDGSIHVIDSLTSVYRDREPDLLSPLRKVIFNLDPSKDIIETEGYLFDKKSLNFGNNNRYEIRIDWKNARLVQIGSTSVVLSGLDLLVVKGDVLSSITLDMNENENSHYTYDGFHLYFSDGVQLAKIDLDTLAVEKFDIPSQGSLVTLLEITPKDQVLNLVIYNSNKGSHTKIEFDKVREHFKIVEVTGGEFFASIFDLIKVDSLN